MGCTRRHFLLSTCFLQLISILERQVFDFLGYMWAPILINFFHIIFVIFGFYGAYHFRVKYIITYLIWNFIWIGWNTFLICFYLDIGVLDKNSDILNLGTGSVSWFEVNGYGCKPIYPINITSEDPYRPVRPENVNDCLLDYPVIEIIHSGIQCILAFLAIIGAILIAYLFIDEDDQFDFMGGDAKSPQHTSVHPMYVSYSSIPTSASATILSINHNNNIKKQFIHTNSNIDQENNQKNENINNKFYNNTEDYFDSNIKLPSSYTNNSYCNSNNRKPVISSSRASTVSLHTQYNQQQSPQTHQQNDAQNFNSNNNNISNNRKSYNSNFINRPDIKYTQISSEHLLADAIRGGNNSCALDTTTVTTTNLDDSNENINLQTFKNIANDSGDSISSNTYVQFQKPSPIFPISTTNISSGSGITIDGNNSFNGDIIHPIRDNSQIMINSFENNLPSNSSEIGHDNEGYTIPILNTCNYYNHSIHSVPHYQQQPQNSSMVRVGLPLTNSFVRQYQRSGQQPYPDLSPEVTEKYSMPQQYISNTQNNYKQQRSSPVLSRISARRRQDRSQVANFCDQIRDAPPGYNDAAAVNVSRAKSHDRISNRNNLNSGSKKSKHRQSLYSIEYGSPIDTIRSRDTILDYDDPIDECNGQLSPKPMTPRRVKRRSVMTRGSNGRQSTASRRSHKGASGGTGTSSGTSHRSSTRSSRRKHHHHLQNPVTKIMEQQQQQIKNHHHHHHQQLQQQNNIQISTIKPPFASFTHIDNPTLTESNLQSLNNEILATTTAATNKAAINYKSFSKNISPDPIYYNMSGASTGMPLKTNQQQQQQQQQQPQPQQSSPTWNSNNSPIGTPTLMGTAGGMSAINSGNHIQQSYGGHYNPTYQHSTTNLTNNENEHVDELYNNRPPSVRSSYSNFHGTRPLSSYNPTTSTTENVFVGLTGGSGNNTQQQQQQQQILHQQSAHQHHHSHLPSTSSTTSSQPQIIPSSRRSASRESIRSMAFLNNGPPAYNLNYHTPPDSETTM